MRYVKSARFVRGRMVDNTSPRKIIREIALTSKALILGFHSPKTFDVASNQVTNLRTGIVVIQGSANAGIYEIKSITPVTESSTRIEVKRGNFQVAGGVGATLLFANKIVIRHGLNTLDVDFTLKDKLSGDYYTIDTRTPDKNTLILNPHVPIDGKFRITIVG
ncbi:hypothetical protein QQ008_07765 [Fulvivirgaceae bacterium BMA10]|uniref:Uncharacterized protein n=1 Tax=Splendidivirga corallicola TaxID=3051826 RepID=A0ABT8KLE4_9BACT|nr:hypothetical protein [Fulvivirgaceae bacterium BMA10]